MTIVVALVTALIVLVTAVFWAFKKGCDIADSKLDEAKRLGYALAKKEWEKEKLLIYEKVKNTVTYDSASINSIGVQKLGATIKP